MNLLNDCITYVRRIIKSPSQQVITDTMIIDYINRFYTSDVSLRVQLFDLKSVYSFQTIPGVTSYNMPLYQVQTEGDGSQGTISFYPVYQGFTNPVSVNGVQSPFYTEPGSYYGLWPNFVQYLNPAAYGTGNSSTVYQINLNNAPVIPGHLDMAGVIAAGNVSDPIFSTSVPRDIRYSSFQSAVSFTAQDATGNNMTVQDSGVFLSSTSDGQLRGLLITQQPFSSAGPPTLTGYQPYNPSGYQIYSTYSTTQNVVNYVQGTAYVTFPNAVPSGAPINAQCMFFNPGLPRGVLFYNNTIVVRPPPDIAYNIQLSAYLTPAAFMQTTDSIPYAYMTEYLARGAARKILADTGDTEQFMFYEPLFKEQEMLVWKRSQRQFTATRTATIYSDTQGGNNFNQFGGGI